MRIVPDGFDSKLVRLKVTDNRAAWARVVSFDSKLVRLKGLMLPATPLMMAVFRFQIGAIKSFVPCIVDPNYALVSIPNWCD